MAVWVCTMPYHMNCTNASFLGTFAKFWKVTVSLIMSVCLSVHLHETTQLPLDGYSCNVIFEYFSKNFQEHSSLMKLWEEWQCTWRPVYILIISCSVLLRMRNVSDKSCRGRGRCAITEWCIHNDIHFISGWEIRYSKINSSVIIRSAYSVFSSKV